MIKAQGDQPARRMKKEVRLLATKAVDSLVLSVEHYNRPSDRGRVPAVLILLDHAFEMILKASILHRGGSIRQPRAKQTIGFDECVRKAHSDGSIKFLKDEQVLQLQAINSLRDAAQHHLLDISEQHLYLHAQAGLTLFRDLYRFVFQKDLREQLPERVLPISTSPPTDLATLFDHELAEIRKLLKPGGRRRIEATNKLRALAIVDNAFSGQKVQPGSRALQDLATQAKGGKSWEDLFPGVAALDLTCTGTGPSLDLRLTKKEGIPVALVPAGTPDAAVIGVKRIDELGFYNLGLRELARHIGLSQPRALALIQHVKLQQDPDCFKAFQIGSQVLKRYSQHAISKLKTALASVDLDQVWIQNKPQGRVPKNAKSQSEQATRPISARVA